MGTFSVFNAVGVGTAALLRMQQPSLQGLGESFQESPVWEHRVRLSRGSTNGTGGHVHSPHAKPGSTCPAREQGGECSALTPPSAAPLHSPVYNPVNLFEI